MEPLYHHDSSKILEGTRYTWVGTVQPYSCLGAGEAAQGELFWADLAEA